MKGVKDSKRSAVGVLVCKANWGGWPVSHA